MTVWAITRCKHNWFSLRHEEQIIPLINFKQLFQSQRTEDNVIMILISNKIV